MSSLLSFLKILFVPVAIAALHQIILLVMARLHLQVDMDHGVLTQEDAARSAFLGQATLTLLLTLFVGLPFMRFSARRGRSGYLTWMAAWAMVHLPTVGFSVYANLIVESRWLVVSSLIGSIVSVTGLCWQLFYAEPQQVITR